jgi:hypothetical protein
MTDIDFRSALLGKIADSEAELSALRAALDAYDHAGSSPASSAEPSGPLGRFTGMRPTFRAVEIVLKEHGGRMKRADLVSELVAGGAIVGKKRKEHNLRISIDDNAELGKLILDGDDVVLG